MVSADGLGTISYKKDELVATIVTNEKGYATLENLPLGKYYVVETKTIEGFVFRFHTKGCRTFLCGSEYSCRICWNVCNQYERQKVQITVIKKDAETKEVIKRQHLDCLQKLTL